MGGASSPQTQVAVSIREIEEDGMVFGPLLRHKICISYERLAPRRCNTSNRAKSVTGSQAQAAGAIPGLCDEKLSSGRDVGRRKELQGMQSQS